MSSQPTSPTSPTQTGAAPTSPAAINGVPTEVDDTQPAPVGESRESITAATTLVESQPGEIRSKPASVGERKSLSVCSDAGSQANGEVRTGTGSVKVADGNSSAGVAEEEVREDSRLQQFRALFTRAEFYSGGGEGGGGFDHIDVYLLPRTDAHQVIRRLLSIG